MICRAVHDDRLTKNRLGGDKILCLVTILNIVFGQINVSEKISFLRSLTNKQLSFNLLYA